jgi:ABC-type multidrug transport system ATPase subunit
VIRVEGLRKRYGSVAALEDLTFSVRRSETFAIIGPNGAGKTTTLKCLLGLVRPDGGRILLGDPGRSPEEPSAREALGYVPQRVEFPAGRSVADVLGYFARLRGLGPDAPALALERVGMRSMSARRATDLSGGYLQRLSLAQALLGDPDLLVLDEPTASLDPQATWEFRSLVLELRAQGKTIVLCSHLLSEVERVADRVLILVEGRVAALECLSDLRLRQHGASRIVLDVNGDVAQAGPLLAARGWAWSRDDRGRLRVDAGDAGPLEPVDLLRAAGVTVRGIEVHRPTLEEVFLEAVSREAGGRT